MDSHATKCVVAEMLHEVVATLPIEVEQADSRIDAETGGKKILGPAVFVERPQLRFVLGEDPADSRRADQVAIDQMLDDLSGAPFARPGLSLQFVVRQAGDGITQDADAFGVMMQESAIEHN